MFTVSLPVRKKRALNPFEEVVLKLTEVESNDTERLSDSCGLDPELVSFIQNRLYQLGLLSPRYDLADEGRELLDSFNKSSEEPEYSVVRVFVDLHNGNIIPYVNSTDLIYENVNYLDEKNGRVSFSIGAAGRGHTVNARIIRPGEESYWDVKPTSADIQKAITEFKKTFARYSILSSNTDNSPPLVVSRGAISVQNTPDIVYLHLKAVVQKGNPEIIVTDGIGFGFSSNFRRYLVNQDFEWIHDLIGQGVIDTIDPEIHSESEDIANIPSKYKEIRKRLKLARIAIANVENINSDSTNSEREAKRYADKAIRNMYASLEWSLRQVVFDNRAVHWESIFSSQSFKDNERLLYEFARNIGFSLSEKSQKILQVKPGAIRQITNGAVELQPLLALSLAGANSDPNHPFHKLAYSNPAFLDFSFGLKTLRDPIEHGSSHEANIALSELVEIEGELLRIIGCLVSDIEQDLSSDTFRTVPTGSIDQVRLKARLSLDRSFGLAFLDRLDRDLKEQLTRVEICKQELSDENHMALVTALASSMQLAISVVLSELSQSVILTSDLKETAFRRAVDAGLVISVDTVPKPLATVSSNRVDQAAVGVKSTLGAQLIAFIALSTDQELKKIGKRTPHLIDTVSEIIGLRGHGNTTVLNTTEGDLLSLTNSAFEIIRSLMEN
ncbi:hypothetical protein N9241_01160 [bacterium]|nr:hypothetical protein [bacterium]